MKTCTTNSSVCCDNKSKCTTVWNQHIIDEKISKLSMLEYTLYSIYKNPYVERGIELTNEINYDLDKVFQFFVANPGKIIDVEHILKMLQLKQHEKWQNPTDNQYRVIYNYIKEYLDSQLTVLSEDQVGFYGYMFINNKSVTKSGMNLWILSRALSK